MSEEHPMTITTENAARPEVARRLEAEIRELNREIQRRMQQELVASKTQGSRRQRNLISLYRNS
jgi:hypothetical protein